MSATEHGNYMFKVKEDRNGGVFLALELFDGEPIKLLTYNLFCIHLREGTTTDQAHRLADQLNDQKDSVSLTNLARA